jgi:hypothetical protein
VRLILACATVTHVCGSYCYLLCVRGCGVGMFVCQEENKRIRAAQRKQIIQEMEDKELTFSPQINQKSIEILQSEPTPRRALKKSDFGKLKHNQLPGHEQESFRPAINKRSQLASTDAAGVPVYDRLYGEAVTKLVSKKAAIVRSRFMLCLRARTI